MRITKLSLTNFKSFKETQTIDFAPVTLLFGPNSVGKSTVLLALFYLQQILKEGQCDPAYIDALGGKYVGGFKGLIHGRDRTKSIKIKIEYDKGSAIGSTYTDLIDLIGDILPVELSSPVSEARLIAVEFEIKWSERAGTAFVSEYKVWFDEIEVATVSSESGAKQSVVTSLNYLHPLMVPDDHDDWLLDTYESALPIHRAYLEEAIELKGYKVPGKLDNKSGELTLDEAEIITYGEDCFATKFHELLNEGRISSNDYESKSHQIECSAYHLLHSPISIEGFSGALPKMGKSLKSAISFDDTRIDVAVNLLLSDLLVAPLDNILKLLNESICIGPLRLIPDINSHVKSQVSQSDWYDGKACWDEMSSIQLHRDSQINDWLVSPDKLNLGYQFVYKSTDIEELHILASMDAETADDVLMINRSVGEQLKVTESEIRKKNGINSNLLLSKQQLVSTKTVLWDCLNNIEVSASDIGVGVSQLLPLVVASFTQYASLIACEQPELHVHPRIQVAIADLLTQLDKPRNYLIETHSEHLILRLLRRIRETTENELPDNFKNVVPTDVSIVYIEPGEKGATTRRIHIDEDGEFKEKWPHGFFSERREELI